MYYIKYNIKYYIKNTDKPTTYPHEIFIPALD